MYSEPSCESRSALPAGRRSGAPFPASPPCAASSGLLAALLRRAAHAASLPRWLHPLLPRARKPLNPAPCTLGSCTLGSCTLWTCTLHPCTLQLCNPAALQPAPYISVPPRLCALRSTAYPHPFHGSGGDPNFTHCATGMKSSHRGRVVSQSLFGPLLRAPSQGVCHEFHPRSPPARTPGSAGSRHGAGRGKRRKEETAGKMFYLGNRQEG